jgi:alpha-1,2-mannosyltransferase
VLAAVGVALMRWTPIDLMPKHHETTAALWRQLAGMSYVWWALALIVAAGLTVTAPLTSSHSTARRPAPDPLPADQPA